MKGSYEGININKDAHIDNTVWTHVIKKNLAWILWISQLYPPPWVAKGGGSRVPDGLQRGVKIMEKDARPLPRVYAIVLFAIVC